MSLSRDRGAGEPDKGRFFTFGLGQDKVDKEETVILDILNGKRQFNDQETFKV